MAIISLRSRSHVKASVVLTRADHLFIHNYIISLLNIILISIVMVLRWHEPVSYRTSYTACVSDVLATEPHSQLYIYIYIYIYIYVCMHVFI